MKPSLSLRVSQHLALTPQLQQSIRLLQLSTQELSQEVEQMLGDNPFLEVDEAPAPQAESTWDADGGATLERHGAADEGDASHDFIAASVSSVSAEGKKDVDFFTPETEVPSDWEGDGGVDMASFDEGEWGGEAPARGSYVEEGDAPSAQERAGAQPSLNDFLHQQTLSLRLSELDRYALQFLIENLNEDGYLEDSLAALAMGLAGPDDEEQLEELLHRFTVALHLLQSLEPVGVGARDLAECLRLQLHDLQRQQGACAALDAAAQLCLQPLELLARRDVRKLVQLCALPESAVRAALAVIARLEPKPGRRFAQVERHIIVPDVIVQPMRRAGSEGVAQFSVQLNPDVMPRLRVHEVYANALRGHKGGEGHTGLQQRLQEARWFIKNVQQRFDTILRVSQAIVERQKNFLVHGELAMRPLVLRDIADELGLHESTISRVTTAKYMATPQGTFELKYFFGSGLETETGGSASSTAVRALIKQLIAAENPHKPLSDSQLAELLKAQGIECARRTVAKYREGLKIPVASLRKAL